MKSLGGTEPSGNAVRPAGEKGPEAVQKAIDFSKVEIEPLFADMVDFETFSK